MSGQQIGTVVGGVVGSFFGMPQVGMLIGPIVGECIDPSAIKQGDNGEPDPDRSSIWLRTMRGRYPHHGGASSRSADT